MEELIERLEIKIKKLLDQHNLLKQSHQHLHKGAFQLTREKEHLLAKQQKAITQIETLISRLKSIEKLS